MIPKKRIKLTFLRRFYSDIIESRILIRIAEVLKEAEIPLVVVEIQKSSIDRVFKHKFSDGLQSSKFNLETTD